jgi:hypothetical protein
MDFGELQILGHALSRLLESVTEVVAESHGAPTPPQGER